jgi:hypothetical protein
MSESINRNGFPRSGNFLAFLKMYAGLEPSQRKNVFISRSDEAGIFNYCVFPSTVTLPPDCEGYIRTADSVVGIMAERTEPASPKPQR